MDEKKYFLLINNTHYRWNPATTSIEKLTEEDFFSQYKKETDVLTLLAHKCNACPKVEAEKLDKDGIPKTFESEQEYLQFIYNEPDARRRIRAKAIFDQKFRS